MKKITLLIAVSFILVACGSVKIHENVNKDIAKDAIQVMDRITYNVNKDIQIEDVSDKDDKLFERYTNKYIEKTDTIPIKIEGVDKSIIAMSSASLVRYAKGANLTSDKENIKENKEYMNEFIETGIEAGG